LHSSLVLGVAAVLGAASASATERSVGAQTCAPCLLLCVSSMFRALRWRACGLCRSCVLPSLLLLLHGWARSVRRRRRSEAGVCEGGATTARHVARVHVWTSNDEAGNFSWGRRASCHSSAVDSLRPSAAFRPSLWPTTEESDSYPRTNSCFQRCRGMTDDCFAPFYLPPRSLLRQRSPLNATRPKLHAPPRGDRSC
jgi:hypothetical protein